MRIKPIRRRIYFLITLLFFISCPPVKGFEVGGFRSGMTQKEVKEILSKNYSIYKIYEREKGNEDGKLTSIQRNFSPSIKNFIILFDKLTLLYGKPYHCLSDKPFSGIDPMEIRGIVFVWRMHSDTIRLEYYIFPTYDQLSVFYSE